MWCSELIFAALCILVIVTMLLETSKQNYKQCLTVMDCLAVLVCQIIHVSPQTDTMPLKLNLSLVCLNSSLISSGVILTSLVSFIDLVKSTLNLTYTIVNDV